MPQWPNCVARTINALNKLHVPKGRLLGHCVRGTIKCGKATARVQHLGIIYIYIQYIDG